MLTVGYKIQYTLCTREVSVNDEHKIREPFYKPIDYIYSLLYTYSSIVLKNCPIKTSWLNTNVYSIKVNVLSLFGYKIICSKLSFSVH